MRIALLLPTLDGGGAQRVFLTLAEVLAVRGYEVELVVGQRRGDLVATVPKGMTAVDLERRHLRTALPALVRYLRARRPDCLLSTMNHANVLAIAATRLARTSTGVVVRVANTLSYHGSVRASPFRPVTLALARRMYRAADLVIAVSKGVASELTGFANLRPDAITVIPNPVVPADLAVRCRQPPDHPWFQAGQPPVVLGMGRLAPHKNFPALVEAFQTVRASIEARLVILGEGEERPRIVQLADACGVSSEIALPGFVPNPYPYLARAAAYVLSSNREGLPGALIQAMACGVPVVATDCRNGPREILHDGEFGRLVPVGDVAALARAIHRALVDPRPAPPR
ncbi:MAG TPA: glycosyltransferase, partial [Methylomirabilota bacterium]|nr:glycosyltransferase [Methylomirabilota bacterium]